MKCSKCQTELPEQSKFCLKCGEKIEEEENKIENLCHNYFKMGYCAGILSSKKNKKVKSLLTEMNEKLPFFCKLMQEAKEFVSEYSFDNKKTSKKK